MVCCGVTRSVIRMTSYGGKSRLPAHFAHPATITAGAPAPARWSAGPDAMAGLSALPLGGPPSWVERPRALTHRPNSETCPTLRGTAFQRHSGVAGPPPAWLRCDGSPDTTRRVRRDRRSGRLGSVGRSRDHHLRLLMTDSSSKAPRVLPSCSHQQVNRRSMPAADFPQR
jgi:hypothetical protein